MSDLFLKILNFIKLFLPYGLYKLIIYIKMHSNKNKINRKINFTLRDLKKNGRRVNLELGETRHRLAEWITIDIAKGADLILDLNNPLPFPDNCIDQIYCSHLLEHFTFENITKLLLECVRILKKGGTLQVAVPDANLYIEAYLHPEEFDINKYGVYKTAFNYYSEIDYLNYIAYMGGCHHYMFDKKQLILILVSAGFHKVDLRGFDPKLDLEEKKEESIYAIAER